MENRYLYKAKRIDDGEWVQGYYVKGSDMYGKETHVIFEPDAIFYSHGETDGLTEIDPSTICQCTGLKDKNGKLIWENDIVNCITTDCEEYARKIVYDKEELDFKATNGKEDYGSEFEYLSCLVEIEVTGNVFDNPELFEGKNHAD